MLEHIWHWRFAKKLSPALQENRLLYFAKNPNDDDTKDELNEQKGDVPEQREEPREMGKVLNISSETSGAITELAPEIAETVAWSPFILEQTQEILRGTALRKRFPDVDFEKMERSIHLRIKELGKGKDETSLSEGITEDMEQFVNDDVLAVKLAEAFEKRMEVMHEQLQYLGDTNPSDIIALEHRLGLQDKSLTAYTDEASWEDAEVDEVLETLNIDPELVLDKNRDAMNPEQQKTLDALLQSVDITDADIGLDNKPTKKYKLRVIQKKVMAARKIAAMERNDINSETSAESTGQMETRLFQQMQLARKHALGLLKKRAEGLSSRFKERITPLVTKYADQPELVAAELGITVTALHRRLGEVHSVLEQAKGTAINDPNVLKDISDREFTQKSTRLSRGLESLSWITTENDEEFTAQLAGSDASDEVSDVEERKSSITWMVNYAPSLMHVSERLESDAVLWEQVTSAFGDFGNLKDIALFATDLAAKDGIPEPADEEFLYDECTPRRRRQFKLIIAAVESPHILGAMRTERQEVERDTTENTETVRADLDSQLLKIEQSCFGNGIDAAPTHEALQHDAVKALGADMMMRSKLKSLQSTLASAENMGAGKGQQIIRECALEVRKFTEAVAQLDALSNTRIVELDDLSAYKKACGAADTTGCYNQGDGNIYLNINLIDNDATRSHTLHHEQGHAIVDTLMRRTNLLPQLFVGVSMYLKQKIPGNADERTFEDMLLERAEAWKIKDLYPKLLEQETATATAEGLTGERLSTIATQRADGRYKELLMDELINKFASYRNGTGSFSTEDKALFAVLNEDNTSPNAPTVSAEFQATAADGIALQNTDADNDSIEGGGGGGITIAANTTESIGASRNNILKIRQFIDTHKNLEGIQSIQERYELEKDFLENDVEKPFYAKEISEAELAPKLQALEDDIGEVLKEIDRIKALELDLSKQGASGTGGGLLGFLRNIEFVSIMDMVNTVKQGAEDIQRMWKRRGERAQSKLGKSLTGWIGDWVPYAGQLKHEYDKRGNASEIAEVNQWKEAIKEEDSYALLDMLGTTRNRDQVRAIGEVLVERGRMDWNYEPFWRTLNALSIYNMPIGPCQGSDILRDKWLQKLITDIWGDKDKYFEWRQQNDGAVNSGKKKFSTTADQLSNVSGGLAANLERQLKLWTNNKGDRKIPEDVNPHLYEEVLHYAMRNGKMAMEEKLYYLVHGVASGLLSIDRLRAMAGEDGGILNQFPFIDYFTVKNNTMAEVQALAKRLKETGKKEFAPGPKTTLWLHLELTRNESARQRMAKATSGARTESLDHEDIPTIISQMDFKGAEELTGVLSGSRFKMSNEAAKNTYTGFGTKFKILAQLASLHKNNKAQFTDQDAQEAAKSIATYAHLDNILTRNGTDGAQRIEVTLDQIASQTAPSAAPHKVKEFRDGNSKLVRQVIDGINLDWTEIGVSKDEYIRSSAEEASQTIVDDTDRQKRNFNATKKFSRALSQSLADPANRDKLIDILANMAGDFREENYFDEIKSERVETYLKERRQHGNVDAPLAAA